MVLWWQAAGGNARLVVFPIGLPICALNDAKCYNLDLNEAKYYNSDMNDAKCYNLDVNDAKCYNIDAPPQRLTNLVVLPHEVQRSKGGKPWAASESRCSLQAALAAYRCVTDAATTRARSRYRWRPVACKAAVTPALTAEVVLRTPCWAASTNLMRGEQGFDAVHVGVLPAVGRDDSCHM
jgi:hypothetical protein